MKKLFLLLTLVCSFAFAEATFEQIETLIQQQQYQAAEQGLEVIIKNHPNSAKAFYAMAQAQAGLGNLDKAKYALNKATGLNPTLDFAPSSSVASLRQAISPQVTKIEPIEESHFGRNLVLFGMFVLFVAASYFLYSVYARKRDDERGSSAGSNPKPTPPQDSPSDRAYMRTHNLDTPSKEKIAEKVSESAKRAPVARAVEPAPAAPVQPAPVYVAPQPTVIHTHSNNSSSDLLTGVILGNMMSDHHHHDRVIEREVVREVPAPSGRSTWDDTPTPRYAAETKSSSWDDDTPSKSSSSWSSSSDSSSSSSWDSGSSSSDSGSSWD